MVESPRWYEKHGHLQEAEAVMERIEAIATAEKGPLPQPVQAGAQEIVRSASFTELFRGKYLKWTLVLLVAWIFQTLGFYGFSSWVPTLLAAHGFSLTSTLTYSSAITLGAPVGALIAALVSDRIDRKWSITGTAVIIAVFGLLYGATFQPIFIVVFGFLVNVFIQTFASFIYVYSPELYPTEARASGAGLTYGVGRLANALGPIIVSILFVSYGYVSVFVYISACWALVALSVGFFGPLTSRRSLEQISGGEEHVGVVAAAGS
jgi:putative MFS transporter